MTPTFTQPGSLVRATLAGLLLSLLAASAYADEGRVLRYSILSAGHPSGSEVDTYGAGGAVDSIYEYNDRGRGPKVRAHYNFGSDGLPLAIDVTGVNYLKAKVDEHFAATAAGSSWHSEGEHGQSHDKGFYVTTDGTTAVELSALVRVLAYAAGGKVALLPGGEARVEFVAETTLPGNGRKLHVCEAAVTGLDFTPTVI